MKVYNLLDKVNELLKNSGISASVAGESPLKSGAELSGGGLLVLQLKDSGNSGIISRNNDRLVQHLDDDGAITLRWLLPKMASGGSCEVTDSLRGERYIMPTVFRLKAFDERGRKFEVPVKTKRGGKENGADEQKTKLVNVTPLNLCPDLEDEEDGSGVYSAWLRDVRIKWKNFAKKMKPDKTRSDKAKPGIGEFVRLETGLNSFFVSQRARGSARSGDEERLPKDANPLAVIEAKRHVLTDWPAHSLGRLRIPHTSHKYRLCPYQTPESVKTGLSLTLAADASVDADSGRITPGKKLLSVAVGMVPYPSHTDGPRLMMGGKNMKQAEPGIRGAEPALVPGLYEGKEAQYIDALKEHLESERLFPYIGTNALTVIMPFKGYTYEDGLVVSRSLADKLSIDKGHYEYFWQKRGMTISKSDAFKYDDLAGLIADRKNPTAHELTEYIKSVMACQCNGKTFSYADPLPSPGIDMQLDDKVYEWDERYMHHARGVFEKAEVSCVIKEQGNDNITADITIKWKFTVKRPLMLGDKLTGRNGNKGVITRILPDDEMPKIHFADGPEPAELIISPSSVMGRKNLGQIWEMTHSLLINKGPEDITERSELKGDDIKKLPGMLTNIGTDDKRGTFRVTWDGGECRAFAGWQYFCRLHHHALKKLQARGVFNVPYDPMTGQPQRCGSLTGQRMGEMENWSLLSHGANAVLNAMRDEHTGRSHKSLDLLVRVLRSLNIEVNTADCMSITGESPKNFTDISLFDLLHPSKELKEKFKKRLLLRVTSMRDISKDGSMLDEMKKHWAAAEEYRNRFADGDKRPATFTWSRYFDDDGAFFDDDGAFFVDSMLLEHVSSLRTALMKMYRGGNSSEKINGFKDYVDTLIGLLSHKTGIPRQYLLGRRYDRSGRAVIVPDPELPIHEVRLPLAMLVEMLDGLDEGYLAKLFAAMPNDIKDIDSLRRAANDFPDEVEITDCDSERRTAAQALDAFLGSPDGELWGFLVRQPSLHRHSLQSFRFRCWEQPVIAIPPIVTSGFNADFDGDTMAVFLPPYAEARNADTMRRFSIINNPGTVGDGKSAFADGLDLALGWWNMDKSEKDKSEKDKSKKSKEWYDKYDIEYKENETYSDYFTKFLKSAANMSFDGRSSALLDLQSTICRNSTGAATLAPLEFAELCDVLAKAVVRPETDEDRDDDLIPCTRGGMISKDDAKSLKKKAEDVLKALLKEAPYSDFGLNTMLRSKAKGKIDDVLQMTWALGTVEKMIDEDDGPDEIRKTCEEGSLAAQDRREEVFIEGNFWRGLTDDEMFIYSYPSRYSMAQKKLSVAEAGYLTRQLAEGLYDITVGDRDCGDDCGTDDGLRIKYAGIDGGIDGAEMLTVNGVPLPTLADLKDKPQGDIGKDLTRVAWGRVPLGMKRALTEDDIKAICAYWCNGTEIGADFKDLADHLEKNGRDLIIRSPLTCRHGKDGRVCRMCVGADTAQRPYDDVTLMGHGAAVGITAAQAIGERGTQLAMKRFHDVTGGGSGGAASGDKSKGEQQSAKSEQPAENAPEKKSAINEMRSLLVSGESMSDEQSKGSGSKRKRSDDKRKHKLTQFISGLPSKGMKDLLSSLKISEMTGKSKDIAELLTTLFLRVLVKQVPEGSNDDAKGDPRIANGELPQSLIHYEIALMQQLYGNDPDSKAGKRRGLKKVAEKSAGRLLSAMAGEDVRQILKDARDGGEQGRDDLSSVKSSLMSTKSADKSVLRSASRKKLK